MLKDCLEEFLEALKEEIDQCARKLLKRDMPKLTEELFSLFEKTGNRLQYEAVYFERRKFLTVLGLKAILSAQGEKELYLEKLAEVIQDICGEECWALPAHVDRCANPDWRITIDLFAAETAQTLAELTDRLGGYLPADICRLAASNIEKRVLVPFFASEEPYSGWERAGHNWNAVCSGGIGSACIHMLKWDPGHFCGLLSEIEEIRKRREEKGKFAASLLKPSDCLERICRALGFYLEGFAEDGACMEGLGYYNYGMSYFVNFAQELYEYTEGEQDLFCGKWGDLEAIPGRKGKDTKSIEKNGEGIWKDQRLKIARFPAKCFWKDGNSISFSDGTSHETFRTGISSVLALHYGDFFSEEGIVAGGQGFGALFPGMRGAAGLHADPCYRFAPLKLDLLYGERLLKSLTEKNGGEDLMGEEKIQSFFLPSAQWYIANAENGTGFACKGGNNGEPHNHNDIGHFIYEAEGNIFFTDLGAGEYTKEYFGNGRYDILCNSSLGHSVPIINGQGQGTGADFRCSEFYISQESCKDVTLILELHSAYPEGLLDQFGRVFSFHKETGKLVVRDTFVFPSGRGDPGVIVENFITQISPVVSKNQIFLKKGSRGCILEIDQTDPDIRVKEAVHYNHQGLPESVYLIQWRVPCMTGNGTAKWGIWTES